ncbi:Tn7 transposase TnsA N-terminal domain-containing protein [Amycolatopsis sp. NPDC058986]|uniref:Tn7 transposase TnsA N-terminal domain-containing protein n=1 Tax=unclassified Amycolatopsis TaxID=2618356 RepID=UPI00366E639F
MVCELIAVLAGVYLGRGADDLSSAVGGALASLRQNLVAEVKAAGFAERATRRWAAILDDVEWPETLAEIAPDRSDFSPLREVNPRPGSTEWESAKVGRKVACESVNEMYMVRTLSYAANVEWFCEQPVAIEYFLDGRVRTYYPDLLVWLDDGRCVLVEVKGLPDMASWINQEKAEAARKYCARRGWGFIVTDGTRTLRQFMRREVSEEVATLFKNALSGGVVSWPQIQAMRARADFTSVDVSVLALREKWRLTYPYRLAFR